MDDAKLSIAPDSKPEDWKKKIESNDCSLFLPSIQIVDFKSIAIGGRLFQDNVSRQPGSLFDDDIYGDSLPQTPTVLTGMLDDWPAFSEPGISWSVGDLATRLTKNKLSLDGGPSFARMSYCSGKVTLSEYQRYCENDADGDNIAPLYIFDPDVLLSTFDDADKSSVSDAYSIPTCFSKDTMSCINGSQHRPLPPAWLLVGVARSGTPIHNHPFTVAWNALLVGCKLWCCLPPDVDESLLQLNLNDENDDADFDLSAMEWFHQMQRDDLPESAKIIIQHIGEVVYLPRGWFHVVLNVETSTAISVSLALRRDLQTALPPLMEEDNEFISFWYERLLLSPYKDDLHHSWCSQRRIE